VLILLLLGGGYFIATKAGVDLPGLDVIFGGKHLSAETLDKEIAPIVIEDMQHRARAAWLKKVGEPESGDIQKMQEMAKMIQLVDNITIREIGGRRLSTDTSSKQFQDRQYKITVDFEVPPELGMSDRETRRVYYFKQLSGNRWRIAY